jgi:flagellar hook-associated protein 2
LGLSTADGAHKQDATNSIMLVNGATFESSSNTLVVNGLTINAKAETAGEVTVTTEADVDGIYNMIKDFFTEYNTLINSIDTAYNADSIKGYEPLTDDEKEDMTEAEIDKWEEKIKASLLRRDSTLDSIAGVLKNAMQKTFEIDGTSFGLSSFGINTLDILLQEKTRKMLFILMETQMIP